MSVGGSYDCITKTPLGDQKGVLTVIPGDGDSFTGNITGDLGSMDIRDGRISGNTLSWQMKMTMPMPMDLDCTATVEGDVITGKVKAGMFGTMDLTGTRRA
ncbi:MULTISPECIES: hypothetical protein [Novosphingobium]|uniref:Uncharacterized protein n=1 Tax=Novosphingobium pentaromativorans US6-1 TaxID=1088721 RepID=G6E8J3_9SPHN|nr:MULTISPECIES: hypothetical protein [Novosphingobium]AIT81321.1 signal peptide protein [Novosphingobium pentaromativorans US6-1]EHJ62533.1 hypothetical protein NSU_0664 [Novosphingobium pentaromativorans US6-1]GFM29940.1 uncharacterized protein PY1_contig-08-519 [Novosphingobium sp. PY1]